MKNVLFLILALAFCGAAHAQSPVVSDSVQDASLMRPAHAVDEDIRWNIASPDLFTFWIDNGLYGYYGPQPTILVDGLPMDANFFGWQNLNMLPITNMQQRDFQFDPTSLSPAGTINFNHSPSDTGFSATTSFFAGNETGDPGPWVYDSLRTTPNIDRWGPDGELSVSYQGDKWYSKGAFVARDHLPTDLASNARLHYTASLLGTNMRYVNHPPHTFTRSGLLETGYNNQQWGIRTRGAYGQSHDYLFLQPFGREVPAKTEYKQLAFEGYYEMTDWKFTGRYIGHRKTIDKRLDLHTYIFDWDQRSHKLSFSGTYGTEEIRFKPGLTYERLLTEAPGLEKMPDNIITLSLDGAYPLSKISTLKGHLNIDYDERRIAKTYRLNFPTEFTPHWTINPEILHAELPPVRQHSFSYWINRGYTFADELGIPYSDSVAVKESKLTALKLRNSILITPDVSIILEQQVIDHQILNVPFQAVESNEFITDTDSGRFTLTQEKGNRLGLYGEIKHRFSNTFHHSFSVHLQQTLSGTERYERYFDQVPETKLKYQLDVRPVPTLMLSANILHRSSTKWIEFKAIEGNEYRLLDGIPIREVRGTFSTETPAFTNISLSAKKWFWDQRLSTSFSIRNLLNQELRMHTLGADKNTQFNVEISLNL